MRNDYHIVRRSDDYLEHAVASGAGGAAGNRSHKYIHKVKTSSGWRYFYTPAQIAAYMAGRARGAIQTAGKAVGGALSSVKRKAGWAANKVRMGYSLGSRGIGVGSKNLATRLGAFAGGVARSADRARRALGGAAASAGKAVGGAATSAYKSARQGVMRATAAKGSDIRRKTTDTGHSNYSNGAPKSNAKSGSASKNGRIKKIRDGSARKHASASSNRDRVSGSGASSVNKRWTQKNMGAAQTSFGDRSNERPQATALGSIRGTNGRATASTNISTGANERRKQNRRQRGRNRN